MKFVSYHSETGPRLAALVASGYVDLNRENSEIPFCIKEFLAKKDVLFPLAKQAAVNGRVIPRNSVKLFPPVPNPQKIICVGVNYADHAAEVGMEIPLEPVIFNKFPTALIAHGDKIVLPNISNRVDYEAELVVVIGQAGKNIPAERAYGHVAGYCCGNDVSARDWQKGKPGKQWLLGKTFDTFAPVGPELVLKEEVTDPMNLGIRLILNGKVMQNSNTNQCLFDISTLIAYISQICTLQVGDLIFTGTPPGVGDMLKPPVYLKPGDVVEVEIDSVGKLQNLVV